MPLSGEDRAYVERHRARVEKLLDQGHLLAAADGEEIFCLRRRPQRHINLRGTGETFAILAGGRTIGTVDGVRVLHECHPGAVYLHAGRQYLVEALEREERRVQAVAADLDYFTTPLTEKETEILEVLDERRDGPLQAWLGRLKVTERVVGFERKRIHGQERIDQTPLDLPPVRFETVGLWWTAPRAVEETLRRRGEHFLGSLHASEHAGISLFPILALCDRGDIGGISYPLHPQLGCGAVFIYDGHPGGVGIAARGFADLPDLLGRVRRLVEGCPCETGCPSCVQSPKCGNGNRPLDKAGAARVLRLLLGVEEAAVEWGPPLPGPTLEQALALLPDPTPGLPGQTDRPLPSGPHLPGPPLPKGEEGEKPDSPVFSPSLPLGERGQGSEGFAGISVKGSEGFADITVDLPQRPSLFQRAFSFFFRKETPRQPEPRTVLFDLETLRSASDVGGWGQAHRMGVAVGVVCHLEEGRFEVFPEPRVKALVEALKAATLVVGYNNRRFDYRVLSGYTGEDYARLLPTLDLLEEVHSRLGFRVGMGHLAQETLGTSKSADGLKSLEWVRQGRLDLVEQYCRRDVEILRDLYLHGRREGYLLYRDRRRDVRLKLRVGW
jgi:DEAD/DEAH box helicase domain-containing protein